MHPMTEEALKDLAGTMGRWTTSLTRADKYVTAIDERLPENFVNGSSVSRTLSVYYGSIEINVYEADEVAQVGPYLRIMREAGFRRVSRKDNVDGNRVEWLYVAEDTVEAKVNLHLKHGDLATCRYVETGVTEVPVMELLCGEKLEAWVEANE